MFRTALLIYNGNAGQNEKEQIFTSIIPILSKEITNLTLSKTEEEGDAELIVKNQGESYEIIISLGGDGTLHEVINGIAELNDPPLIGILPAGTCNDFARSLEIPLDLAEAAETILKCKTKFINIGKVNHRYFTNFVGVGIITDIVDNLNPDAKNKMGRISYYTAALKSINNKEDFEFVLKTENEEIKDKAGMIIVLNGYYVGSSLVPVESIDLQDDLFNIFIVYDAGLSLLLKYLTQKENFEKQVTEAEIKHIQAKDIIIKTKKQMSLDTDGEVYLETPIKINVLGKKFEFIVG